MLSNTYELLPVYEVPEPPDYEKALRDLIDLPSRIDALVAETAELRERLRQARTLFEMRLRNTAAAACGRVK